jgi:hypothetical protein
MLGLSGSTCLLDPMGDAAGPRRNSGGARPVHPSGRTGKTTVRSLGHRSSKAASKIRASRRAPTYAGKPISGYPASWLAGCRQFASFNNSPAAQPGFVARRAAGRIPPANRLCSATLGRAEMIALPSSSAWRAAIWRRCSSDPPQAQFVSLFFLSYIRKVLRSDRSQPWQSTRFLSRCSGSVKPRK